MNVRAESQRLRNAGLTYGAIAKKLGVPKSNVVRWSKLDRSERTGVRPDPATAIAPETPTPVNGAKLRKVLFGGATQPTPYTELRTLFGRSTNLDWISTAIQNAQRGFMRQLTDLSRETLDTDPHLASVLQKRLGSVATLPFEVVPASGAGVEPEKARLYADFVREQLSKIPNFRQNIFQLAWGLYDGRAVLEIDWAYFGARDLGATWQVRGLEWIHPRRITFGPERELRVLDIYEEAGFTLAGQALRDFPRKFVEFTPQLFGDYQEREGLSPRCVYWSFFKRFGARERMILLELFGKPWRIIEVDEESSADADDLEAADEIADRLGSSSTARMPRGTRLAIKAPGRSAGQIHQEVIEESDRQISKLVLGQTGTTEGGGSVPGAAGVLAGEQFLILQRDALMIAEAIESHLTDAIIDLNFGSSELPHAPKFLLRAEVPVDRVVELQRLKAAVDAGLEVPLEVAQEIAGIRAPRSGEAVIRIDVPPTAGPMAQPPMPRPVIVYPAGETPPVGEQSPPAAIAVSETELVDTAEAAAGSSVQIGVADMAVIVTVNEARAANHLGPLNLPDGTEDPDGYLTIAEFRAKRETLGENVANVEVPPPEPPPGPGGPPGGGAPPSSEPEGEPEAEPPVEEEKTDASFHPGGKISLPQLVVAGLSSRDASVLLDSYSSTAASTPPHVCLARQPDTVNGSPETLVERGVRESARMIDGWVDAYAEAVSGKETALDILAALRRAHEKIGVAPQAKLVERRMLHGAMLGILDHAWEVENDVDVAPAKFSDPGKSLRRFAAMTFEEAVRHFKGKKAISKAEFDKLAAAVKRRAFTVANAASAELLRTFQAELARQIADGGQLREFEAAVRSRAGLAGWTPANASHVETIYRTNVLDSYTAGRVKHATQPEVMAERPYWKVRTVGDNRQRKPHGAVDGFVLRADDPFWANGMPPWGFNCRCRVSSVRASKVDPAEVKTAADMRGLPDEGFTAGTSGLL